MSRKLVTIRKIDEINEIKGADKIECAVVGGWTVVVKKGEFKVNDKAFFFEVDSFLPVKEPFMFLEKSSLRTMYGKKGLRLKTIRLRGQLSSGLLLPLSSAKYIGDLIYDNVGKVIGVDTYDNL